MHRIKHIFFVSVFVLLVNVLFAQIFSPYSQYGLGTLHNSSSGVTAAMGGINAAFNSPYNINYVNPAAIANIQLTSFDIGLKLNTSSITAVSNSPFTVADGGVNNISLSFPVIKNTWGMAFGLLPYSFTKYKISTSNTLGNLNYTTLREGEGSLYKLFLTNGVQWKGLKLGLNTEFIFGKLENSVTNNFTDNSNNNGSRLVKSMSLRDVVINAGIQYNVILTKFEDRQKDKENLELTLGAYFAPSLKVDAFVSEYLEATKISTITGNAFAIDTASGAIFGKYMAVDVPTNLGVGVMIGKKDKWNLGMDYDYKSWTNFASPISSSSLTDEWHLKLGGSFLPDNRSDKYLKRVTYRLGTYFGKTPIIHENTSVSDFGITFGFGIPFARHKHSNRSLSNLNFAFEIGALGINEEQSLTENYYNFTLTYTLSDLWFRKQKFD